MPREEKRPVELRPVDDNEESEPKPKVIRLHAPGDESEGVPEKPVKLGKPADGDDAPSRLFVPERREVEIRSHQPGIEALLDDTGPAESTEQTWGQAAVDRNPIPWGWFALIALGIAAAVVWSLLRVRESQDVAETIREETTSALIEDEREEAEARALIERIESVLTAFFAVRRVDKWQRLIRHPERVMPLVREYHAGNAKLPGPLRSVRMLGPLTLDRSGDFWMASVMLASGELRNLLIEIDENGDPRVDWETLVCHQPMPWDEFARKRPEEQPMNFRVYVEADNFFSHEFADSNQWLSFRLTALDADETLFGYLRAGHEDLAEIVRCLRINEGRKTSLILRLNIPRGLQSRRGVVIEKLMSPRWLYMNSPDTDS